MPGMLLYIMLLLLIFLTGSFLKDSDAAFFLLLPEAMKNGILPNIITPPAASIMPGVSRFLLPLPVILLIKFLLPIMIPVMPTAAPPPSNTHAVVF